MPNAAGSWVTTHPLMMIGLIFLVGLAADVIGRRTGVPRVTTLILCGVLAGPHGLQIIPTLPEGLLSDLSVVTLSFVAFLLGGAFEHRSLARLARDVGIISGLVTLSTLLFVSVGVWAAGFDPVIALALAAVATATDPVATTDVINEQRRAKTPFGRRLTAIVAIDDAWGIVSFSLLMVLASTLSGEETASAMASAAREIGGGLMLGALLAVPMALLTGRVAAGEPTLAEALGFVLICAGLAEWLHVSALLAAMTMGAFTVNFARHHARPFHAIEGIEWPLLIMFFVLTGASVGVADPMAVAGLAAVYCVTRIAGRWAGGHVGGWVAGIDRDERAWMGLSLLPQAGVALGMALVAAQRHPQLGSAFLSAVAISTIAFELFGPVLTRMALRRVGALPGGSDAPR